LGILESLLRVHMQVDQSGDGAFAVWAMEVVEDLAARDCATQVMGIKASSDQRPISPAARLIVDQVLTLVSDRASVRVLTDGVEDYLSVAFPDTGSQSRIEEVMRAAGLVLGGSFQVEGHVVDLDVEPTSPGNLVTLVVSRRSNP
jgi:hypothetical protein